VFALTWCAVARAEAPLDGDVRRLIAAHRLKKARVGVHAVDLGTGRVLCSLDAERPLIPASNMKLVTTAVALRLLGEKHQFTTAVYAKGEVADARLDGDLIVVADGDPCLNGRGNDGKATAVFDRWAAKIARTIRVANGNLIIDVSAFDRQYVHPNWPGNQLLRSYCAPVSAFALNDNCIDVKVRPADAAGAPAKVLLEPPTRHVEIRNRCETVASIARPRAYISRSPQSDTLLISGTLTPRSAGAGASVPLQSPEHFAATVLRERLARAGVAIRGKTLLAVRPMAVDGLTPIAEARHSLLDAIRVANKESQNFYAEMIFKTLGRRAGEPATFGKAALIVSHELAKMGIPAGKFTIDDGSGLSRKNEISAGHLVTLLRAAAAGPGAREFVGSLAVAGIDGTLRKRLHAPPYKGAVRAKTGHINGVSTLSGYARSKRGPIAFSILTNGRVAGVGNRFQDAVCRLLVDTEP
jgi:PBP4 family serine-type D-alanyl-D-alanine carboxypeptidase